ncbi:MAG TPA: hypothetical protein PKN32_03435 [Bacteroidales bacterium]|nr:hypothetical protein [Bacteroidales bacterium]
MSFADNYFSRFKSLPKIFNNNPCPDTGIIVVIPCFDDEFIFQTLESLDNANPPNYKTEVIIIVNSGENSSQQSVEHNRIIYDELRQKQDRLFYKNFDLLPYLIENTPKKIAGVGFARKTGMDEAVRRFNAIKKAEGIIVSLDADCKLDKNYFDEIIGYYEINPNSGACTIQFKHDFDQNIYSEEVISACMLYEIYLRYFRLALKYCGFPYPLHTIGSCFSVTAQSYIKAGGMSQRQGGEDFYFLHKLALMTQIGVINKALVFPSPRISYRVPFGTGPAVSKIIKENKYDVYNFKLFGIIKAFYDNCDNFYFQSTDIKSLVPKEIIEFIGIDKIVSIISDCLKNTNNLQSFRKRFYSKFDTFFIIKFLNSHDYSRVFPPENVLTAASQLLDEYCNMQSEKTVKNVYDDIYLKDIEL